MTPVVSVVLPVWNGAAHLAEAIESILAQDFHDLELIVVDNGSVDASGDIAADYARADDRVRQIRIERAEHCKSGARAERVGLEAARGAFIARMDHDDVSLPQRLSTLLAFMRRQDLDACGGQAEFFGAENRPVWFPEGEAAFRAELVFRIAMANSLRLTRVAVAKAHPPDDQVTADDYEWQTRLAFSHRFGNAPQMLGRIRLHAAQTSRQQRGDLLNDWTRLRFVYFFRLFPDARLEDFQAVNVVANDGAIGETEQLSLAGRWLARLATAPDVQLKRRMARRWDRACERATVPPATVAAITAHVRRQILPDDALGSD